MKNAWNVTFEVVTEQSAMESDYAERGFDLKDASFRDAITYFGLGGLPGCCEADCCPVTLSMPPRWFTRDVSADNAKGERDESRSLHIPEHVTPSSRMRIARLVGCYGAERKA